MSNGHTRVLVADDNPVDRKVLTSIVKSAGYLVDEAVDGIDALAKYEADPPDLVLLDALMPGKDGFEVAQEIRANSDGAFVPIIFLTSLTEASELVKCLEAGGDDFLSKPYNKIILQAKLNAFDRMREMRAGRDKICIYDAEMQAKRILHFPSDTNLNARMLIQFYAFVFLES